MNYCNPEGFRNEIKALLAKGDIGRRVLKSFSFKTTGPASRKLIMLTIGKNIGPGKA